MVKCQNCWCHKWKQQSKRKKYIEEEQKNIKKTNCPSCQNNLDVFRCDESLDWKEYLYVKKQLEFGNYHLNKDGEPEENNIGE
jgi:hypothetical protein